jgi:uncharacterized protein YcfJ
VPPYTLSHVAKAGTATIGAMATAVLGLTVGHTRTGRMLVAAAAVGTAVATYAVPNAPTSDAAAPTGVEPH